MHYLKVESRKLNIYEGHKSLAHSSFSGSLIEIKDCERIVLGNKEFLLAVAEVIGEHANKVIEESPMSNC